MQPERAILEKVFRQKHGDPATTGNSPRRRHRYGYFTPDDVYEAVVAQLVGSGCTWIDVGGGRDLFPSNSKLARLLADRCHHLVGVDPSPNIDENPYVHERARCLIEDFQGEQTFDLATMRMVAEHIAEPRPAILSLARLVKPGGKVVVYTVNRWAPVTIASWIVPFRLHHPIKRLLWKTDEIDTFPVAYRMNTRGVLAALFEQGGFRESAFAYLDDCRAFHRSPVLNHVELALWKALNTLGLRYPENCLLGVYERVTSLEPKETRKQAAAAHAVG